MRIVLGTGHADDALPLPYLRQGWETCGNTGTIVRALGSMLRKTCGDPGTKQSTTGDVVPVAARAVIAVLEDAALLRLEESVRVAA